MNVTEKVLVFFIVSIIFFITLGGYFIEVQTCKVKAQSFNHHEYKIIGGCMVEHEGKMVPLENVRVL